ncbi:MAG: DUF4296 domain-containing protein [Ginsengibacter sp.]
MKLFFFIILISFLFSCADKNKPPSGIIPPKEMSEIMWDVIRAQTLANEIARKDSSINVESQTEVLTKKVFEIHRTTSFSFDKSYEWYTSHPDVLRLMFDSLYTQKQRANDLQKRDEYNHVKKDSLSLKINKK